VYVLHAERRGGTCLHLASMRDTWERGGRGRGLAGGAGCGGLG
jgi:hypothetical protein